MSKMIQIRNVPDSLHRKMKARAAMEGMSLSDYLLRIMTQSAEKPTMAEFLERLSKREPVRIEIDSARLIREERDAR